MRPIGGAVLGFFGDRFGRKKIFANTLIWMAGATFIMGITPTFNSLGITATIIFSLCRLIQALVFGAEFPGALTILSEHIDHKKHGLHFGFMVSAVGLGVSLGSLVIWILTKLLSDQEMTNWGFRIPFILGGTLAIIGFHIRKHLPETPQFLATKQTKNTPSIKLIKDHIYQLVIVAGISLFPASLSTFKLTFPVYLNEFYHFSLNDIYLAMTFGYTWSAIMKPIFGWASDYTGKKVMIIASAVLMIIFVFPVFSLLNLRTNLALFVFVFFSQTITSSIAASYFVLLPKAFQTAVRYTGVGISHNITHLIAALTPLVMTYVYSVAQNPNYLIFGFIALASLTIVSTIAFKAK